MGAVRGYERASCWPFSMPMSSAPGCLGTPTPMVAALLPIRHLPVSSWSKRHGPSGVHFSRQAVRRGRHSPERRGCPAPDGCFPGGVTGRVGGKAEGGKWFLVFLTSLLVLAASLSQAVDVMAHAKLQRAEPPPGSIVKTPPAVVRLWFSMSPNEELDPRRSTVSVWDRRGRRVDDGKGGVDLNDMDRRSMIARLKPIGPGTYTVRWKAVTIPDRGLSQGSFNFTVAPSRIP